MDPDAEEGNEGGEGGDPRDRNSELVNSNLVDQAANQAESLANRLREAGLARERKHQERL